MTERELCAAALKLQGSARLAYLEQACGSDRPPPELAVSLPKAFTRGSTTDRSVASADKGRCCNQSLRRSRFGQARRAGNQQRSGGSCSGRLAATFRRTINPSARAIPRQSL
jgi:hypothetical protein